MRQYRPSQVQVERWISYIQTAVQGMRRNNLEERGDRAMPETEVGTTAQVHLYLVRMLCADCYHRFNQVTKYAGYRWHRCPKCGGYFAKKVWNTKAVPLERHDSEDKAG